MHLTNLRLRHFRNHVDSSFQFGSGTNLLLGDNGEGKTNVLEAISYLCLTKSFYASSDAVARGFGGEMFEVGGTFVSGGGSEHHIRVAYTRSPVVEKVVTVDRRHVEPFTSMIGRFPIVTSSPEYAAIIAGAPMERRKFIDLVISQSSSAYLQHLINYRKVLRNSNRILKEARIEGRDCSELLVPWDEQLIGSGSALTHRRAKFVREFQEFVSSSYHHLVGSTEAEIGTMLEANLEQMRSIEMRAGVTLIGPQRDEIVFKINGLDVRDYASQGQQKTFLIALKMAEFFYLKDRSGETPILLLDDIFSELDEHRAKELLHFVEGLSQTFITSTTPRFFENGAAMDDSHKRFLIRKGAVIEEGVPV